MTKTLTALAAAATIAIAAVAAPQQAEARHWHRGAFFGGLAAGALIGSAAYGAYGPYYGYGPGPYYAYGPGYGCPHRVWTRWGWRWSRYCG